jgi:hypothetical protein
MPYQGLFRLQHKFNHSLSHKFKSLKSKLEVHVSNFEVFSSYLTENILQVYFDYYFREIIAIFMVHAVA